jgi:hypothetical protein
MIYLKEFRLSRDILKIKNNLSKNNFIIFYLRTSFISAKELDTKYSTEHLRTVDKMRKVKKLTSLNYDENFVLPLITVHSSQVAGLTLSEARKDNKEKFENKEKI